jgi:hypothetical protein
LGTKSPPFLVPAIHQLDISWSNFALRARSDILSEKGHESLKRAIRVKDAAVLLNLILVLRNLRLSTSDVLLLNRRDRARNINFRSVFDLALEILGFIQKD